MIKDIEAKNESKSICDKEIAVLKEHFPACFSGDGSFDIERFKEIINTKVDITKEGYELRFLGKSYAKFLASLDTTTVITPNIEHNHLPENKESDNVYISGDNLDGLKHLLKSYANKVKCIYIDPPYNTGSDGFVYNDNFTFTSESLQHKLSIEEDEAQRILDLTKSGSASHSAWLLFMYPRLQLAKDLLTDDGVIFISIDDNEEANLKLLCSDVFGEENFVSKFPRITKKAGKTTDLIASNNDYVLCYKRSHNLILNSFTVNDSGYKHKDKHLDSRGKFKLSQTLDYGSIQYSQSLDYEILVDGEIFRPGSVSKSEMEQRINDNPKSDFCWRWSKDLYDFGLKNDFIVIKEGKNGKRIYTKTYKKARISKKDGNYFIEQFERTKSATSLEFTDNKYSNDNSRKDLSKLFDKKVFDYTKPVSLLKTIIELTTSNGDVILDFFSGSATTAEAIIKLNANQESEYGNRKFITIQLPEKLNEKNSSHKITYDFLKSIGRPTTLDYVGVERIIRASKKIKEETKADIDYGFKHYILNVPEQNTLDKCETFDKASLIPDGSILDDFGAETVLTTWLNYDGYGLNATAQEIDLNGYKGYYFDKHLYLINPDFTKENVLTLFEKYEAIGDFNPENVILFGYSFNEWSVTEMLEQNLKILNDTEKNLKININVRY